MLPSTPKAEDQQKLFLAALKALKNKSFSRDQVQRGDSKEAEGLYIPKICYCLHKEDGKTTY